MIESNFSSDEIMAKLIEMGFESSDVVHALKKVGPSVNDAVSYLSDCRRENLGTRSHPRTFRTSTSGNNSASINRFRQSSILDHFRSPKRIRTVCESDLAINIGREPICVPELNNAKCLPKKDRVISEPDCNVNVDRVDFGFAEFGNAKCVRENVRVLPPIGEDGSLDWEIRANNLLQKHFGYSSLKDFQKKALAAWANHEDCLVLAATGSGKSLCFQIPALLSRKVVVVISPLISLMHDQCLKLSKHGVSACFLGSGQPDSSVEQKAMGGMYDVIYVCPETVFRLITSLQKLAESRGIALFAIDEVHCVSKWGHDFRPDYRKLSVLRENFSARKLQFLKFDIPLMALTATATIRVREDVLKSLNMSANAKIVLTSFFRPNLRFLVKHSRTSSPSSYEKDFCQLIDRYGLKRKTNEAKRVITAKEFHNGFNFCSKSSILEAEVEDENDSGEGCSDTDDGDVNKFPGNDGSTAMEGEEMSVEYLENEVDVFQSVDDWDVACGEFCGQSLKEDLHNVGSFDTIDPFNELEDRIELLKKPLGEGPTIIYVPTRKETLVIADFLRRSGVKAAAYNACLKKSQLRQVHEDFHDNRLEVVVATIAFGMGIDKSNVRRIIHYGWPQSLEAYYQEAGRAGRDGKLAECILYADLTRMPSLLPSKRSEDQTKQAYKMLSDCFRYGMSTSCCRAKVLVQYFGEDFCDDKCLLCDVCVEGPPKTQNLKEEAGILMQVIAAYYGQAGYLEDSYADALTSHEQEDIIRKPKLKTFVSKIMELSQKFSAKDHLWWRGLARIMEAKGYIRENDGKINVQIKCPEPTKLGLEFLQYEREEPFYCCPEADMLLSRERCESYSGFQYCGKGWADPDIRRERLKRRQLSRPKRKSGTPGKARKRKSNKLKPDTRTSRGRIAAKLLNLK